MALKRREDIYFAEVGDEFFCCLEQEDVLACLNKPAFVLVENLDGFIEPSDFVKAFAEKSHLDAKEVATAVDVVARQLHKSGFLVEVEAPNSTKKGPFNLDYDGAITALPKLIRVWSARELAGGMFVSSQSGDIHVIVPNVTDGPIKTCPPHTCTIPSGLFTPETIIRTFNKDWTKNFERFRRTGFVQFKTRKY